MSSKIEWHTEKKKLKDLKELENNPRIISPRAYEQLQNALKIGNFKPLIADIDGVILGGNQKYKVLLEKYGEDYEVEVSIPERKLTESEQKDIVILDNKHMGEDNPDALADQFAESLEKFGFADVIDEVVPEETEIDMEMIKDMGLLVFRLKRQDYMKALELLANAVEKTESESNEECIMKLLLEYE